MTDSSVPAAPVVSGRSSTLTGRGGGLATYEAARGADKSAGLIILHEAFGVTDHITDVCRRAAAAGYYAVAPDLFHRSGGGVAAYGDLMAAAAYFKAVTDDGVLEDVDACIAHLVGLGIPTERIGVIGFCFGGRAAFLTAVSRKLGAVVTLYGGGIVTPSKFLPFPALIDRVGDLASPWLGQYGEADIGIPLDELDALEKALASEAQVDNEIVRYPGASHAFHNDQLPSYHEASAKAAWPRALQWLVDHGVTPAN